MGSGKSKSKGVVDASVVLVFLALFSYVYAGFFFTDPRIRWQPEVIAMLWAARICLPFAGGAALWLYFSVRSGRTRLFSAILLLASFLLCALLGYPFLSYVHDKKYFGGDIKRYHPYLQIAPRDYKAREANPDGQVPLKIFCLGGSTTEFRDSAGRGWPTRVEERLSAASPGRPVEVHNLGRQWYTIQHTLLNYMVNLRQHKPDVLIVMHAVNDLLQNADFSSLCFDDFHDDYRHFHGPVARLIHRPTALDTILRLLKSIWYHKPREIVDTTEFPGLAPFERNLRTLIDIARADGTALILMTQPCLNKDSMTPAEIDALRMLHFEAVGPEKKWSLDTDVNIR